MLMFIVRSWSDLCDILAWLAFVPERHHPGANPSRSDTMNRPINDVYYIGDINPLFAELAIILLGTSTVFIGSVLLLENITI